MLEVLRQQKENLLLYWRGNKKFGSGVVCIKERLKKGTQRRLSVLSRWKIIKAWIKAMLTERKERGSRIISKVIWKNLVTNWGFGTESNVPPIFAPGGQNDVNTFCWKKLQLLLERISVENLGVSRIDDFVKSLNAKGKREWRVWMSVILMLF